MAYKFPWTNYHELNLDWILNTVKELFAKTEQNNAIVEQYDGRLTEVELTADNAQTAAEQAQTNSATALDLAQNAAQTATQAQQAAATAQQAAGQAQTAAGQALEAAATAQQTATQAQQTAQNFDGRIRQAEDNAASALQAAQAFDEQVQGAITAANNANEAATAALTTSTETARELAAQRDTLEDIIENAAQSLQVDLSTKADVIINTAEGEIASFNDGANDMPIKKLVVNIEPSQSGSGWEAAEIAQTGKNLFDISLLSRINNNVFRSSAFFLKAGSYTFSRPLSDNDLYSWYVRRIVEETPGFINVVTGGALDSKGSFTLAEDSMMYLEFYRGTSISDGTIKDIQIESGSLATAYESFQSRQISVIFPSEAGTVYNGTLDVISGVLTVFPETGTQVVYKLTPQEVKTLYQYNNIWSDAGSVDVEYPADTKTYIDNKFTELQALILEH